MEDLSNLKYTELQARCRAAKRPAYGTKSQLIERLAKAQRTDLTESSQVSQVSLSTTTVNSHVASMQTTKPYELGSYAHKSLRELQEICKNYKISKHGKKEVLVQRLNRYFNAIKTTTNQQQEMQLIDSIEKQLTTNRNLDDTENAIDQYLIDVPAYSIDKPDKAPNTDKPKKTRGLGEIYFPDETTYKSYTDAFDTINKDDWSLGTNSKTHEGKKQYFNCIHRNCNIRIYVLHQTEDGKVYIFRTESDHNHETNPPKKMGMTKHAKERVEYYFVRKVTKPKSLEEILKKEIPNEAPSRDQIRNFLYRFKNQHFGNSKVTIGNREEWRDQQFSDMDEINVAISKSALIKQ